MALDRLWDPSDITIKRIYAQQATEYFKGRHKISASWVNLPVMVGLSQARLTHHGNG